MALNEPTLAVVRPLVPRLCEADRTPPVSSLRCRAMDLLDFLDRTGGALGPAPLTATAARGRIGADRLPPGAPGGAR
ncbi:hypothetical protein GCM10010324_14710 [Streptomyces hiroshimensis]|uniref:Uncharacterized protein n=1 Tax=Streptomyces hiroshimensis TaxID=66424 RepID=A0ABQ2Y6T6_9ACTN|nr:hypothetical protein GCM10010324_14710 [Streptomyces hiroshimensis]